MENLVCIPVEYKKDFLWCIFEKTTEQVVGSFFFEDEAQAYHNFLKRGGAFDGRTPSFILIEIKNRLKKLDINQRFKTITP